MIGPRSVFVATNSDRGMPPPKMSLETRQSSQTMSGKPRTSSRPSLGHRRWRLLFDRWRRASYRSSGGASRHCLSMLEPVPFLNSFKEKENIMSSLASCFVSALQTFNLEKHCAHILSMRKDPVTDFQKARAECARLGAAEPSFVASRKYGAAAGYLAGQVAGQLLLAVPRLLIGDGALHNRLRVIGEHEYAADYRWQTHGLVGTASLAVAAGVGVIGAAAMGAAGAVLGASIGLVLSPVAALSEYQVKDFIRDACHTGVTAGAKIGLVPGFLLALELELYMHYGHLGMIILNEGLAHVGFVVGLLAGAIHGTRQAPIGF